MENLLSLGQIRQGYQNIVARVELNCSLGCHDQSFTSAPDRLAAEAHRTGAPPQFIICGASAAGLEANSTPRPPTRYPCPYIPFMKALVPPHPQELRIDTGVHWGRCLNGRAKCELADARVWTQESGRKSLAVRHKVQNMQDVWMVVFTVVFFVLAFSYVQACQKLR